MKNTMQKYCFFFILPNKIVKKICFLAYFPDFWQLNLAKIRFLPKNLPISKKYTNFVPDKVGHIKKLRSPCRTKSKNPKYKEGKYRQSTKNSV